jgi:predicted ATPase
MRFTHLSLSNWKNFRQVDVPLQRRVFIVGPNASGKSNLLDAVRFLKEIADPEGGFQRAVRSRGGVSQIRCLHARREPSVTVRVQLEIDDEQWEYKLEFSQDAQRRALIRSEQVRKNGHQVLSRPNAADEDDPSRLTQTYLEQVSANKEFRTVEQSLAQVRYLHVIPQLIREPDRTLSRQQDPYGSDFLEQMAKTMRRTLDSRLTRINSALRVAVPQLTDLKLERDDRGVPHLKGRYAHWRPNAGWQTEEHFSDGTLRLLGLLWVFLDGTAPLLLEEPELSLHPAVVRHIPAMMARAGRKDARQVLVSTHSAELLTDPGIAPEEVIMLEPTLDGSKVSVAADHQQVRDLLEGGLPIADAVLPRTAPSEVGQLALFE